MANKLDPMDIKQILVFVCLQTNVYQYGLSVLFYKNSEIVSYFCFLSPHYFVRGRLKTKIFSQ
jgi:hypothetical protein